MKDRVLLVCQRYGTEINGGAEMECRAYAEHLTEKYEVHVLSTCAINYTDWKNEYPEGETEINGVHVFRFSNARERKQAEFDRLTGIAYAEDHTDADEERWIDAQGPYSPEAIRWLKKRAGEYRAVLFMTYLYYLTARGLIPGMKNSILIPTAHDEPPIYLRYYRKIFAAPAGIIYNTDEEKEFVEQRFPETVGKPSCTVGFGIDAPEGELPDARDRFGLGRYILYAGRIDESKGCGDLFRYFREYKKRHPGELQLVLIGKAAMEIPEDPDIRALGFVEESEKYALIRDAEVFVLASRFESLSIVALEAMMMGTPVLLNGQCAVLKGHCVKSNAGLYFNGYYEFDRALAWLMEHPEILPELRENGKRYVEEHYRWDIITEKIAALIERIAGE